MKAALIGLSLVAFGCGSVHNRAPECVPEIEGMKIAIAGDPSWEYVCDAGNWTRRAVEIFPVFDALPEGQIALIDMTKPQRPATLVISGPANFAGTKFDRVTIHVECEDGSASTFEFSATGDKFRLTKTGCEGEQ